MNPHGFVSDSDARPEVCRDPRHVDGCPCRAGGDAIRRKQPVVSRSPALWIAGEDRVAHARAHRPSARTACGRPAVDERFAWPEKTRCAMCQEVIAHVEREPA